MSTTINPTTIPGAGVNALILKAEQPEQSPTTGALNQKAELPSDIPAAEAPAFRGKEKLVGKIIPEAKKLTPEEAFMERVAGMTCAASTPDKEVLKETVLRETALGNFDFVRGINEYLANNAAKGTYKNKI